MSAAPPAFVCRAGRLDRKIEFPHPNEEARAKILQIHSRKMTVSPDVNFDELARSTDDFNAAQLKAVSRGGGAARAQGVRTTGATAGMVAQQTGLSVFV